MEEEISQEEEPQQGRTSAGRNRTGDQSGFIAFRRDCDYRTGRREFGR